MRVAYALRRPAERHTGAGQRHAHTARALSPRREHRRRTDPVVARTSPTFVCGQQQKSLPQLHSNLAVLVRPSPSVVHGTKEHGWHLCCTKSICSSR